MATQPQPQKGQSGRANIYSLPAQGREVGPVQVNLSPIAAPSILGLYGFAGATFIVAANLAGWYGGVLSPTFLFPFAAFFGGVAQFLAGMWAYRARDGLATAMHGMWGSFWMAYGLLWLLIANGTLVLPVLGFTELGYWFIPLSVITFTGAIAAGARSWALTVVLGFLGLGAALAAFGFISPNSGFVTAAGYSFIISAIAAWYTASGLMFEPIFGRSILPLGSRERRPDVSLGNGEPGVISGQ